MDCSTPGLPILHYLLELVQVHVHWIGDAIYPSHPLSPSSPSALNLAQHQGLFQWVSSLYQVAKVLELQHQHHSFQLIFRVDFFSGWLAYLLTVQGTLSDLLQHHSLKALILWHSAFFIVQFSHLHVATGKTIALTLWTFVGKVMNLLFNILSRFAIAFLPRSNHRLISWLQSSSTVILEPQKRKSITAATFPPSICHEVMGLDATILVFFNTEF